MFFSGRKIEGTSGSSRRERSFASNAQQNNGALTVAEVTDRIKRTLADSFRDVSVLGEISNLSVPRSGHAYFSLKDESAQLGAVIWSAQFRKLPFNLSDGMKVVCRGRIEVYPPQGRYQLVVSSLEPVGVGALELAFRQLQDKLRREGLFDQSRKKPLPQFIERVGVVTSATSAAFRDFLNILERRSKRVDVILAPTRVQGEGAGADVAKALRRLDSLRDRLHLDAIALIRGGGSVEDLWTFNEEIVARAVASLHLPVVTGIGHEVDTSICDLIADVHALTPSDAAARLTPRDDQWFQSTLNDWEKRIERAINARLDRKSARLDYLEQELLANNPTKVYAERRLRWLADMKARLERGGEKIVEMRERSLDNIEPRLARGIELAVVSAERKLQESTAKLEALSPLAVLNRGFAIVRRLDNQTIVRSPNEVEPGDAVETTLAQGKIRSIVV